MNLAAPAPPASDAPAAPAPIGGESLSVIIPTRGRPRHLARTLRALALQSLPGFEILLVGDAPEGLPRPAAARGLRRLPCPAPNVSRARNIGAAAAEGEVLFFLDDDSLPEPDWLAALAAPFADPAAALAGGRVRSWNGLSDEAPPALVDGEARRRPLGDAGGAPPGGASAEGAASAEGEEGWIPIPQRPGLAFAALGAAHAVRAQDLHAVGGYDEALRYYLDETDLALRLAAAGRGAAYAPRAEAQHLRAGSEIRRSDRAPLSLFEIGASCAHFLRRHAPERRDAALARMRAERRRAAIEAMHLGRIAPGAVSRLMEEFDAGALDGLRRRPRMPLLTPPRGAAGRAARPVARRKDASGEGEDDHRTAGASGTPAPATADPRAAGGQAPDGKAPDGKAADGNAAPGCALRKPPACGAPRPAPPRHGAPAARPGALTPGALIPGALILGAARDRAALRAMADRLAAHGWIVTLLELRPGLTPLRLRFTDGGWWLHSGGLWGRAERDGPAIPFRDPHARIRAELERAARRRAADFIVLQRKTAARVGLHSPSWNDLHAPDAPPAAADLAAQAAALRRGYLVVPGPRRMQAAARHC